MAQVHAITNYSKSGNSAQERRKKTRLARQRSDTPKRTVHTAQRLFEQAEKGFPDHFRSQNEKRAARGGPLVGHCMHPTTHWKFAQSIIPRAHLRARPGNDASSTNQFRSVSYFLFPVYGALNSRPKSECTEVTMSSLRSRRQRKRASARQLNADQDQIFFPASQNAQGGENCSWRCVEK